MATYKDNLKQIFNGQPTSWTIGTVSGSIPASYTAPAGGTIVRSIHVSNGNSTAKYVSIVIDANNNTTPSSATTHKHIYWQTPINAYGIHDLTCNIYLAPGDVLRFFAESSGVNIVVSGVEVAEIS